MLEIDGSQGEGGGQILRSSLTLSLLTGRPFRIVRIRAGRPRPGLGRQHLTAVAAAAAVAQAEAVGAERGSGQLTFRPGKVRGGAYTFAVGTAGSTTLVLQTVLPALLHADAPSRLVLEGGTHNPFAPPFEFLDRVFLPVLARMGAHVTARLVRPGFYPAGGGRIEVAVQPVPGLQPFELLKRGAVRRRRATATVARLPRSIAQRELWVVGEQLGWRENELQIEEIPDSAGPGNHLRLEIVCENATEVVSSVGRRGLRAESVAQRAVEEARRYLEAGTPVGEHLADQLLIPLALAGGIFRTLEPTSHLRTNAEIVRTFLDRPIHITADGPTWLVRAEP